MRKFLKYNKRALLYSMAILVGLVFLINIERTNSDFFLLSAMTLYVIILFEITFIWFISKEKLKQLNLPLLSSFSKLKQFLHHLVLPTIFYISIVGFIFYNNQSSLHLILLIFSGVAFVSLFINLKAFYQDKYSIEERTYYVYDLIELISFFCLTYIVLTTQSLYGWEDIFVLGFIFVIMFTLLLLNLYQFNHINLPAIVVSIIASFFSVFIVFLFINFTEFNTLAISIFSFLYYYLVFGMLSHQIDGTLNKDIIIEYLAIFFLTLAFLFGIN